MDQGYFFGGQAEMFSFFRIPNAMVKDSVFASLSVEAKFLYGLLLDRIGLSRKYGWIDSENRVYIIYQIAEISEDMNISRKKAMGCLKELEEFGLVEKKRQGLNRPNILYLKNFMMFVVGSSASSVVGTSGKPKHEDLEDAEKEIPSEIAPQNRKSVSKTGVSVKMNTSGSVERDTSRDAKNDIPGGVENTYQEVPKTTHINHTDESLPNCSHTESDSILSGDEMRMENMSEETVRELVENNLDVSKLIKGEAEDKELIKEIVELIIETLLTSKKTIWVAGEDRDMAYVHGRLMKLRSDHILYVVEQLKSKKGEIGNIRQYLLAMLYNAPTTVNAYYKAKDAQKETDDTGKKRKNKFKNYSESTWDFAGLHSLEKDYNDRKDKEIELGDENGKRYEAIMARAAGDRG